MTPIFASKLGLAFGSYIKGEKRIAVGQDTRTSAQMIKHAIISGLLSTGHYVVDVGTVPTPALHMWIRDKKEFDFGVIVTSSHNPPKDIGVKFILSNGTEISGRDEDIVTKIFYSGKYRYVSWENVGEVTYSHEVVPYYIKKVVRCVDREIIKKAGLHVIVDPGNGAQAKALPYIIRKLGCKVTTVDSQMDGFFPGRSPEPDVNSLGKMRNLIIAIGADFGISTDGDGDRAIFITDKGQFVFGDVTGALIASDLLANAKTKSKLIVTPISSSMLIEKVVAAHGGKLMWTKVGAAHTVYILCKYSGLFAFEENGGCIFPKINLCRDGAITASKISEIIAKKSQPFSEIIETLPQYYQWKTKVPCPKSKVNKVMTKIEKLVSDKKINRLDGLKIYGEDNWVLVRPSGTEPVIRIFGESKDKGFTKKLVEEYVQIVKNFIEES
jgi:phosphomannomutase/phosphoglucomutase